jgi:TetR/AcrR family transcriptional regulator
MKDSTTIGTIKKGRSIFHKSTFDNIPEERREKVLNEAIKEFAANGYNAANINVIAKKAGISIGSLYSYFATKEDLFLTALNKGFGLLEGVLKNIDMNEGDLFDILEKLFRAAHDYAIQYPEINQMYLDLTTQGLSSFSHKLSHKMESITMEFYHEILSDAKKKGVIDSSINDQVISFCIDNLIIMYQFSFTSDYYKERLKIFLGENGIEDNENTISVIIDFIKGALKNQN